MQEWNQTQKQNPPKCSPLSRPEVWLHRDDPFQLRWTKQKLKGIHQWSSRFESVGIHLLPLQGVPPLFWTLLDMQLDEARAFGVPFSQPGGEKRYRKHVLKRQKNLIFNAPYNCRFLNTPSRLLWLKNVLNIKWFLENCIESCHKNTPKTIKINTCVNTGIPAQIFQQKHDDRNNFKLPQLFGSHPPVPSFLDVSGHMVHRPRIHGACATSYEAQRCILHFFFGDVLANCGQKHSLLVTHRSFNQQRSLMIMNWTNKVIIKNIQFNSHLCNAFSSSRSSISAILLEILNNE